MLVLHQKDLKNYLDTIGSKARQLHALHEAGFIVPPFIVVPTTTLQHIEDCEGALRDEVATYFGNKPLAVRSNAFTEDGTTESHAGQFLTRLNESVATVIDALYEVCEQAKSRLGQELDNFTIIIQEYIQPDFAGVTFTRNPQGGREMIIEHIAGSGEKLVSGTVTPARLELFRGLQHTIKRPLTAQHIVTFQKIEALYNWPQDIEWCLKDGNLVIVQTRPITTLSKKEFAQSLYLDAKLPQSDFLFEKTTISEILPRPSPFTLSLLKTLYTKGGPIDRVYSKYGISYAPQNIFIIIGNELYIDREAEIKTLLPAYSYLNNNNHRPTLSSFKGLFRTIKNIVKIQSIPLQYKALFSQLKQALENEPFTQKTAQEAIQQCINDYALVFEINLLAQNAIKKLEAIAKRNKIDPSTLLNSSIPEAFELVPPENVQGNSLEIMNTDTFVSSPATKNTTTLHQFHNEALNAAIFNRLREYGRWLVVKRISEIRARIKDTQKYFWTHEEIEADRASTNEVSIRKHTYYQFADWTLPTTLSSTINSTNTSQPFGIAEGETQGKIVLLENISNKSGDIILYTQLLSPNIAPMFPRLKGIISEQGGLLSHVAILAREYGIPIVSNVNLEKLGIQPGDCVYINGSSGKIRKM